ncbi:MAG: DUF47 family protein [Acidimicrobiia bacterium]
MSTKRWFLPENPDLFGLLQEQVAITVEGMHALVRWAGGDPTGADDVRACEHRADDKKRELWRKLRDAFSPPMDAEDLYSLSADLDEVLNAAKDLVREAEIVRVAPDAPTLEMVQFLADAVGHLADACASLTSRDGDPTADADLAIKSQRKVEKTYRAAMSELMELDDLRAVMVHRELYHRVSRIADLTHVVAERVWYAVVKEG